MRSYLSSEASFLSGEVVYSPPPIEDLAVLSQGETANGPLSFSSQYQYPAVLTFRQLKIDTSTFRRTTSTLRHHDQTWRTVTHVIVVSRPIAGIRTTSTTAPDTQAKIGSARSAIVSSSRRIPAINTTPLLPITHTAFLAGVFLYRSG